MKSISNTSWLLIIIMLIGGCQKKERSFQEEALEIVGKNQRRIELTTAQEKEILTVYTGFEFPLHFIDTKGDAMLTLSEGDRPVTFLDYMPTMEKYTGLQNFHEGICVVRKFTGGFVWIDRNCRQVKHFDSNYASMLPFSEGYCMATLKTGKSWRDTRAVFLDTSGNEAFAGRKFKYATPFFNDSSLVQMDSEEWGYLNHRGDFKPINNNRSTQIYYERMGKDIVKKDLLKKIDSEIDNLVEIYKGKTKKVFDNSYKQFVLEHDYSTKEYRVLDQQLGRVIWSSPPEYRTFTSLADAMAFKDKVTRLYIGGKDLNTFPKAMYAFENVTHLTLHSNDVLRELPAGISSMKNLRYLTLAYLSNLKALPEDILLLKKLEMIELSRCGSNVKGFNELVEKSASLETVNTLNYRFPDELFKRLLKERPNLRLNVEYE